MKRILLCLLCGLIALEGMFSGIAGAFDLKGISGPNLRELYMVIVRDPDAQLLALEKGRIDLLGDVARPVDIERLSRNPGIDLSLARGFHGFFMGFNLRRSPWNNVILRRAAAQAIPRERIVRDLFSGYAEPLFTFLPPASPYFEADVRLWPHDPEGAMEMLRKAGWRWSEQGVLIPPGSDSPLVPMRLLSPTAQTAPTTVELATRTARSLRAIGIPVEAEPMDFATMISRLDRRDFDCYVMAWLMTRDPDSLFAFYHSSMDVEGGYNQTGISDKVLDEALMALRYAPDRKSALAAASVSQKLLSERMPVLPIYSRYFISAVRREWKGVVKTRLTTSDNIWSLLSMEPEGGGTRPLYRCLPDEPRSLSPLTASSTTDWDVLALIYDSMIAIDPETLEDLPWLAEKWELETIPDDGKMETRMTFHLRKDVRWQDGLPLIAADVAYTIDFLKRNAIPRYLDSVRDVKKIEMPDDQTLIVTMANVSFWYFHNIAGLPVLPKHVLERVADWRSWQPEKEKSAVDPSLTALVGTGPFVFREYRPGEFVRLERNERFWLLKKKD